MTKDHVKRITGIIGLVTMATFVLGLAYSISTGFAGFWGGLPFWIICLSILSLVIYDYWDECLRRSD